MSSDSPAGRPAAGRTPIRAGFFRILLLWASLPMALLVPLWIVAGRMFFGISGQLVVIFAVSLGPVLAVLMLFTAVRIIGNAARYRPLAVPARTSVLLLCNYLAGLAFGFTVPDFGDAPGTEVAGTGGSIMTGLLGESSLGMSAALCNPLGIATLGLAVAVLVVTLRDSAVVRGLPAQ